MPGFEALWLPGTDHAGIATQMVVERELASRVSTAATSAARSSSSGSGSGSTTTATRSPTSSSASACSCDWTRERFTLDEGLSRAVRTVFVRLYEEGLIYRDLAIVNWCPRCHTAISDLEVEYEERDGRLWHDRLPARRRIAPCSSSPRRAPRRCSATPPSPCTPTTSATSTSSAEEGDPAAHRPRDPDRRRRILVDPEFGTGAVKVTPAHDPNDFETGERHNLLASIQSSARTAG